MANDKNKRPEKDSKINNEVPDNVEIADTYVADDPTVAADIDGEIPEEGDELEALKNSLQKTEAELEKSKTDYIYLLAEFDNFKKRSLKERSELIKSSTENVLKALLPIIDDFERGLQAVKDTDDAQSVKDGMELIYNKFVKFLEQNGVKEIPTADQPFDVDYHEAIAMVPVDDESKKGKIIDTIAKGYTLNDKVIRFAKVAVGQ